MAALAIKLAVGASPDDQRTGYVKYTIPVPTDEVAAENVTGCSELAVAYSGLGDLPTSSVSAPQLVPE